MKKIKGWYTLFFINTLTIAMLKHNLQAHKFFRLILCTLVFICFSAAVSGCGNKGDLYLPEKGSIDDSSTNKVKKKS